MNPTAEALADRYDRVGQCLMFVRAKGGRVHVVDDLPRPLVYGPKSEEAAGEDVLDFLLGRTATVCGLHLARNRGGLEVSGHFVSAFDDMDLCWHCHQAFADRAALIFQCNPAHDLAEELEQELGGIKESDQ